MGGGEMTATFYIGDAVTVMNRLPEKSVDLVISSPPFLALRSYLPVDHPDKALEGGSQATPGEYVDWLLDVVEACARVLAPHGSLCFELGDTYAGSGQGRNWGLSEAWADKYGSKWASDDDLPKPKVNWNDDAWPLAKSLSLIPETFRFAMVYGINPHTGRTTPPWRLRNVIRWVRPNPPVGALGDKFRPATSELMVFCKAKDRFFDLDAVREQGTSFNRQQGGPNGGKKIGPDPDESLGAWHGNKANAPLLHNPAGAPPLDWWNIPLLDGDEETRYGPKKEPRSHARTAKGVESAPRSAKSANRGGNWATLPELHETQGAPPLDWWNIPPGGYPGAHYAVWPPELLVKPIKAMCPEKVCRRCGEPSRRIVGEAAYVLENGSTVARNTWTSGITKGKGAHSDKPDRGHRFKSAPTLGFSDCGHDDHRPGLVLDPFAGSGTTLSVATGHGRDAWGIDLDERNYELALDRVGPLVLTRAAA